MRIQSFECSLKDLSTLVAAPVYPKGIQTTELKCQHRRYKISDLPLAFKRLLSTCIPIESFRNNFGAVHDVARQEEAQDTLNLVGIHHHCREFLILVGFSEESIDEVARGVPRSSCISAIGIAGKIVDKCRYDLVAICSNQMVQPQIKQRLLESRRCQTREKLARPPTYRTTSYC